MIFHPLYRGAGEEGGVANLNLSRIALILDPPPPPDNYCTVPYVSKN